MEVMMEETFGPVIGIMKVESDEEALTLMNDSPYGLVSYEFHVSVCSADPHFRPHPFGLPQPRNPP
jgi:acyl-CoA reductase-like NAD-dependent aldehyde dehydrogenase